jgi:hypothetical protein
MMGSGNLANFLRTQAFCREVSAIAVSLEREAITNLTNTMTLAAMNTPLMRSAANASHAMLVQATNEKIQREKEATAKRGVPKF